MNKMVTVLIVDNVHYPCKNEENLGSRYLYLFDFHFYQNYNRFFSINARLSLCPFSVVFFFFF